MRISGLWAMMVIMSVFVTATTASAFLIRYDGPYEGRVIDAETNEPVEGVVVLGVWYEERPNVAGSSNTYYDAKETVTDKNGEFKITGQGLKMFSYVGTMHVLIFKAGYEYIGSGLWDSFKLDGGLLLNKVNFEGNKAIIPFKKLTMEERKRQSTPDIYVEERVVTKTEKNLPVHSLFIPKKIKLIVKEINKELIEQGRKPFEEE